MKILALDLSLSQTGYAVIECSSAKATVLEVGHIDNKHKGLAKTSHGHRLSRIYSKLSEVMGNHVDIDVIVREKGVTRFNKATQVIFRVAGVVDLLIETEKQMTVEEVTITEVKKLIAGNGKADKSEVADMVQNYLTESIKFTVDDESDAVAVGITYLLKQEELDEKYIS